jgi:uncharacterized protein (DUF305 family)
MNNKYLIGLILALIVLGAAFAMNRRNESAVENPTSTQVISPNKLVYSDEQFILGMVPHHQEAIDSSNEVLKVATDPEVRSIAEAIVAAQDTEVTQMREWYSNWFDKPYADDGLYSPMMQPVDGLLADDAEAQYVSDMVGHHEHAVLMAQDLLSFSNRPELIKLSQDVIRTQTEEINSLKQILAVKYGKTAPEIDHSNH